MLWPVACRAVRMEHWIVPRFTLLNSLPCSLSQQSQGSPIPWFLLEHHWHPLSSNRLFWPSPLVPNHHARSGGCRRCALSYLGLGPFHLLREQKVKGLGEEKKAWNWQTDPDLSPCGKGCVILTSYEMSGVFLRVKKSISHSQVAFNLYWPTFSYTLQKCIDDLML